jgi:hypothetical protein
MVGVSSWVALSAGTKVFLLLFLQKKKILLLSYEKEAKRLLYSALLQRSMMVVPGRDDLDQGAEPAEIGLVGRPKAGFAMGHHGGDDIGVVDLLAAECEAAGQRTCLRHPTDPGAAG